MSEGLAFLPMYDVSGTRPAAEALWSALRDALRAEGIAAPDTIDRSPSRLDGWSRRDLVLGQTCGLPYISTLADRVTLLGAPDYAVEACPPGFYRSALVVRADDRRTDVGAFFGSTFALNGFDSQSGYAAALSHIAPWAKDGRFFGRAVKTASHKASMEAVGAGAADMASIDAVTWRMSIGREAVTDRLRVLALTEPTPGLPFIARAGAPLEASRRAIERALSDLPTAADAFGIVGFVRFERADYGVIAERLAAANAVVSLPPLEAIDAAGIASPPT